MKQIIASIISLLLAVTSHGADNEFLSLGAYVSDNPSITIPEEAISVLKGRMQQAIAANGFVANNSTGRFAVVANCDILDKDIVPTTPPRVSQKLDLSFAVVDLIDNKVYGSCVMTVSGIGTNETKSFVAAFQKVSAQNQQIKTLLADAKEKILSYYTASCSQIQIETRTLAATGQFDKAIFILMSVPTVCTECYEDCQQLATEIYQQKIDAECKRLLGQARDIWTASQSESSAAEIVRIIGQIDPQASNYEEVETFRNSVSDKLASDAKRQWDFQVKQYEDNRQFKLSIVDACRSVGEVFANNFRLPPINFYKRH